MKTSEITIQSPAGMHARPAGELVKLVKSFAPAKVSISNGAKTVSAASILSILSLGLKCGSIAVITVEGTDNEQSILDEVCSFIGNIKD